MKLRWAASFSRFCEDTRGGITALTVMIFLIMVVSVGMAVDFMRHETYRAELQDALDRGVLAAAAFNQTVDAETTIRAYLKSTNFVQNDYKLDVPKPVVTAKSRTISATATYSVDTFFLRMVGIPTLDIQATGSAIEGAKHVEVSLVLDISTSMVINKSGGSATETRLDVLQRSAHSFLDLMFAPHNQGRLTMSLIPFAGQVNVGETAFDYLNNNSVHSYSRCIDFSAADFTYVENLEDDVTAHPSNTMTQLPPFQSRPQTQHFNYSNYGNGNYGPPGISEVDWGWCPSNAQEIEYFSTNKDALKLRIDGLRTHEATGTFYGAKWGAALLDPNSIGLTSALVTAGDVSGNEIAVPRAYSHKVQKFMVFMTDGATSSQVRLDPSNYNSESDYEHWADNLSSNQSADFNYVNVAGETINAGVTVDESFTADPQTASREAARIAFRNVCETAKDNGVMIFTIGFDLVEDTSLSGDEADKQIAGVARAKADLEACASPNSFYDVKGEKLLEAFSEIASTIQKLRLLN